MGHLALECAECGEEYGPEDLYFHRYTKAGPFCGPCFHVEDARHRLGRHPRCYQCRRPLGPDLFCATCQLRQKQHAPK